MRVGIGYDVHRLVDGRKLIIGGIEIPHPKGLLGHSDADVLLHAISDALLGAASLGDLGSHFPDTDPRTKNASSIDLLSAVTDKIRKAGFRVNNIDAVVIAEEPKLMPHREKMQATISRILGIDPGAVNLKATTEEGLGFTGKKEGIAAWAVVTLQCVGA